MRDPYGNLDKTFNRVKAPSLGISSGADERCPHLHKAYVALPRIGERYCSHGVNLNTHAPTLRNPVIAVWVSSLGYPNCALAE